VPIPSSRQTLHTGVHFKAERIRSVGGESPLARIKRIARRRARRSVTVGLAVAAGDIGDLQPRWTATGRFSHSCCWITFGLILVASASRLRYSAAASGVV